MATTPFFLAILCIAFAGSIGMSRLHLLTQNRTTAWSRQGEINCRKALLKRAAAEIGVTEKTGNNDGERVEEYLAVAGLKRGAPYCAAFISFIFKREGFAQPRTGWSPALFPVSRLARSALLGNILGIYYPELNRIGHVGMIERQDGDWCVSVEANTTLQGGREGGGVFRRRRHIRTIYRIADWLNTGGKSP